MVKQKNIYWSDICETEEFNLAKIDYVLEHPNSKFFGEIEFEDGSSSIPFKKCVKLIKDNLKGNILNRRYYRKNDLLMGRVMAEYPSMLYFSRQLRNFFAIDYYFDVDMATAHWCIVEKLLIDNGFKVPSILKEFIAGKKVFLEKYKLDEKENTRRILSSEFGDTKHLENPLNEINKLIFKDHGLYDIIMDTYPDFNIHKKQTKDIRCPKGSNFSMFLQTCEFNIINKALEYLKNKNIKNGCIMYDGFYVKKEYEDILDLNDLEEHIFKEFDYKYKFVKKSMDVGLFEDDFKLWLLNKNKKDTEINDEYINWKSKFEKNAFYCRKISEIVFDNWNFLKSSKISKIKDTIGADPEYCLLINETYNDKKDKPVLFFDKWILDPEKRAYDIYDFFPEPYKIENAFNLWNGFKNSKIDIDYEEDTKNLVINIFTEFINHMGKSHTDLPLYLTRFLANIVQNPGMKEGILLIITGPEGTFKGTLTRLMGGIIGKEYCWETISDNVFNQYNRILMKKLVVCLNEAESFKIINGNNMLKTLITEVNMTYNEKFETILEAHNFSRFIVSTNENIGAKTTQGDRRNIYIDSEIMNDDLRININNVIDSKEYCKIVFDYLKTIEIPYKTSADWQQNRPITAKHLEVMNHFTDITYRFIYELLNSGNINEIDGKYNIKSGELYDYYKVFMKNYENIKIKNIKEFNAFLDKNLKNYYQSKRNNVCSFKSFDKSIIQYLIKSKYVVVEDILEVDENPFEEVYGERE